MARRTAKVQFIATASGDLAVLPRDDYDRLVAIAEEAREDAAASRIINASREAVAEGREIVLPKTIADRLIKGDNPVRTLREWRGLAQGALAKAADISQSYLSEIEAGRRKGRAGILKRIASELKVPTDALIG